MKIKIDHIAKIEGHAGFVGHIVRGDIEKAQIEVQEGARLIESLLIGRSYTDVPVITSRICGLCPTAHNIASIKALEKALEIKPSKETVLLRELMLAGQIIESHVLHIFFLSATDFFRKRDGLDLAKEKPEFVKKILRLRDFGNNVVKLIGGRAIHPLTPRVGGWHKIPDKDALEQIGLEGEIAMESSIVLVDFVSSLNIPKFERRTEYLAFKPTYNKYSGYYGKINSTKGLVSDSKKFRKEIKEHQEKGSVVKLAKLFGKSYTTDALARLHINKDNLNPRAKTVLKKSKLTFPVYNPFYNILSQSIEVVHFVEECQKISRRLQKMKYENLNTEFQIREGEASAVLEAPRGVLYHYYKINRRGIVVDSDIITPTAQLLVSLNDDLKLYLARVKGYRKEKRELEILKLIHSYDPCISCSVH